MSKEEEVERIIKAALPVLVSGVVEEDRVNVKHPGVFVGVLKYR